MGDAQGRRWPERFVDSLTSNRPPAAATARKKNGLRPTPRSGNPHLRAVDANMVYFSLDSSAYHVKIPSMSGDATRSADVGKAVANLAMMGTDRRKIGLCLDFGGEDGGARIFLT